MDQKHILERWLRQLKDDEITPDALGLGADKDQAMRHLRQEIDKITAAENLAVKSTTPSNPKP